MSVSVCVTFVVFTDRESRTRPISINSGSKEAGEYGLTCGTCFVACRLEVVAVAGLLWILSVLRVRQFFCLFFERTRRAASMRPPCLIYLSTSSISRDTIVDSQSVTTKKVQNSDLKSGACEFSGSCY